MVSYHKPEHLSKRRYFRTISMLCDDEPLSDVQLKTYQTRLQEYRNFLEAVGRLARTGNVSVADESVMIGESGLLTGEALNALQHAGAISVYNMLQLNNWRYPVPLEGEVAVMKRHNPVPDEFLDSERPIRADWPAVYLSECFVEGERAKLNGSVRPLRTFLPPTLSFRNIADIDDDAPEPDIPSAQITAAQDGFEILSTDAGLMVKRAVKEGKENGEVCLDLREGNIIDEVDLIPLEEYYYGRQEGGQDYKEERAEYRYKCVECSSILFSNVKLMYHLLGHTDAKAQASLNFAELNQCKQCFRVFPSPSELRTHVDQVHQAVPDSPHTGPEQQQEHQQQQHIPAPPQTASQLLMQQQHAAAAAEAQQQGSTSTRLAAQSKPEAVPRISGPTECRICGKELANDFALAHHLQATHRQREMPYVCRQCGFRSSLYEDILDHFKKTHGGSNQLLCTYCLRVFTISDAHIQPQGATAPTGGAGAGYGVGQIQVYLQHLKMHLLTAQCRKCPACKLNFTNKSDYALHRKLDHKGSTISSANNTAMSAAQAAQQQVKMEEFLVDVDEMDEEGEAGSQWMDVGGGLVKRMNAQGAARVMDLSSIVVPEEVDQLLCIECGTSLSSGDHKQYLPCSLCRFATCCAPAFTRHGQQEHRQGSTTLHHHLQPLPPGRRPLATTWEADEKGEESVGGHSFHCSECLISDLEGNLLAQHLVEECGVDMVTRTPDPELLGARRETERRIREAEAEERAIYGVEEGSAGGGVMVQMGEEGEEGMQQFILPEGLTLEEGQTLVMIQGDDGQPQFAIVNQEDLIDTAEEGGMEEEDGNQVLMYEDPQQMMAIEDEKENHFA